MPVSPDTRPPEPVALIELAPPELVSLDSYTPSWSHTYGDGMYGTGTYGDLLPDLAIEALPFPVLRPPEFIPVPEVPYLP